jgi:hypothetical protein
MLYVFKVAVTAYSVAVLTYLNNLGTQFCFRNETFFIIFFVLTYVMRHHLGIAWLLEPLLPVTKLFKLFKFKQRFSTLLGTFHNLKKSV